MGLKLTAAVNRMLYRLNQPCVPPASLFLSPFCMFTLYQAPFELLSVYSFNARRIALRSVLFISVEGNGSERGRNFPKSHNQKVELDLNPVLPKTEIGVVHCLASLPVPLWGRAWTQGHLGSQID